MRQGVLTNKRVRLLLGKGSSGFRERRSGERKKKSVRGCIVDANLSVLSAVVVKTGEKDIPGLTGWSIFHCLDAAAVTCVFVDVCIVVTFIVYHMLTCPL